MNCCALCDETLSSANDSKEHIIPHAIGGRMKVRGFICRSCNSSSGQTWDAKLAEQYNWFSVTLNIKREHGVAPNHPVETASGQKLVLHADGSISLKRPEVKISETTTEKTVSIKARTMAEALGILDGLQRKHPKSDLSNFYKNLAETTSPIDSPLRASFEFGGDTAGRSTVKTAVAMACFSGLDARACDKALMYLKGQDMFPVFSDFYLRDLVHDRPTTHTFHVVSIAGDSLSKRLLAYVEYFGIGRFLVELSSSYEGHDMQSTYAIDPVTAQKLALSIDLRISEAEHALWSCKDAAPFELREAAFHQVMPIVLQSMRLRDQQRMFDRGFEETLREMHLDLDQNLTPDQVEEFSRRLANKITPDLLRRLQLRRQPPRGLDDS
uniref:HNH endonuclease n=1 Tax=unclassified Variovorax TaxID=663243 RepID=UPI000D3405CA